MKSTFIYTMALLFTVAFSSFVAYDNEKMRASRGAIGIILLAALITPLIGALGELSDISYDDMSGVEFPEQSYKEQSASDAFARGIELALADRFSLSESDVRVVCSGFDLEHVRAERIQVFLSGKAALADIRAVRAYVEDSRLGECEVTVLFE